MTSRAAPSSEDRLVRADCLRVVRKQMYAAALASPIAGFLLVAAMADHSTSVRRGGWWLAVATGTALTTLMARRTRRRDDDEVLLAWQPEACASLFLTGVLWGSAAVVLPAGVDDEVGVLIVLAFLCGTAACNLVTAAPSVPCFLAAQLPVTILPATWLLVAGNGTTRLLGAACVLFLGVTAVYHREANRFFVEAVRLRRVVEAEQRVTAETNAELMGALARIEQMARTDELTGLPNRRHFLEAFAQTIEDLGSQARRRTDCEAACVAILDIDHFKLVNDTYGHAAGDEVLCALAEIGEATLRSTDCLARIGGEEFAILFRRSSLEEAMVGLERLRRRMEEADVVRGAGIRVTVSAGVTAVRLGATPEELLAEADAALYRAKANGRNQVQAPAARAA